MCYTSIIIFETKTRRAYASKHWNNTYTYTYTCPSVYYVHHCDIYIGTYTSTTPARMNHGLANSKSVQPESRSRNACLYIFGAYTFVRCKRHPPSYAYRAARLMSRRSPQPCTKYTNTMRIHPANDPKYSGIPIVRTKSAGRSPECRYTQVHVPVHEVHIILCYMKTSYRFGGLHTAIIYIYITPSSPHHIRPKTPTMSSVHHRVVPVLPSTVARQDCWLRKNRPVR